MASKEDLEKTIFEYSAKLGIPVPSIVWNSRCDVATPSGKLLYISPEVLEAMSVRDLRVEVGYAYARRVAGRIIARWSLFSGPLVACSITPSYKAIVFATLHGLSVSGAFVILSPVLLAFGSALVICQYWSINGDRIAFGLSRDFAGMKRFLATKGKIKSDGKGVPLDPKALARRTALLERYVQSQVVGKPDQGLGG